MINTFRNLITRMGDKIYKWDLRLLSISLLFIFCLGTSNDLFAQAREFGEDPKQRKQKQAKKGFDSDKLIVGGNLGAAFGTITLVEISPQIGYLVKPNLLLGLGGRYIYYEERSTFVNYSTNIYGGGPFAQFYFLENFIAHAEYEILNLDDFRDPSERVNIESIFVGGGYRSMIGGNSFFSILLLYNLNETYNSPYANPVFRIGFGIGL